MNDTVMLTLTGVAGILLGLIFFGGLWWTVRKGLASDSPAWWFLGSFIVRIGVVLAGFLLIAAGHWERMVACLLGFLVARLIVARMTRSPTNGNPAAILKVTHAP